MNFDSDYTCGHQFKSLKLISFSALRISFYQSYGLLNIFTRPGTDVIYKILSSILLVVIFIRIVVQLEYFDISSNASIRNFV